MFHFLGRKWFITSFFYFYFSYFRFCLSCFSFSSSPAANRCPAERVHPPAAQPLHEDCGRNYVRRFIPRNVTTPLMFVMNCDFISVHCSIRTSGGYFPAFLTVHVAALEFDGGCLCTCRETGQISEVVMPMIWFEEVRLSLTHMEAVVVLVTLDRTLTLTLNPPGAASVSPLFPPLLCCNYCSDHFVPGSACERPNVLLSV